MDSAVEWIWTGLSCLGVVWGVMNIHQAQAELKALKVLNRNGRAQAWAASTLMQEALRLISYAVALALGVAVLLDAAPGHLPRYALILFLLLIVINSGISRWVLRRLNSGPGPQEGDES